VIFHSFIPDICTNAAEGLDTRCGSLSAGMSLTGGTRNTYVASYILGRIKPWLLCTLDVCIVPRHSVAESGVFARWTCVRYTHERHISVWRARQKTWGYNQEPREMHRANRVGEQGTSDCKKLWTTQSNADAL
jgi:hypothetical protein